MRYFCYEEFDETGGYKVTLSEEQILKEYWDYWYSRMCDKFGKDYVDDNYDKEDCLKTWAAVHWAKEVDKPPKNRT